MLLQIRLHDGTSNEIEILESRHACEIATAFDWEAERRRFEQLAETGAECYLPSISFMDDATRMLEFGPNTDQTFWVSYRYSTLKSSFGFYSVDHQSDLQLPACTFEMALDLVRLHYEEKHEEIVAFLPAESDPQDEGPNDACPGPPTNERPATGTGDASHVIA